MIKQIHKSISELLLALNPALSIMPAIRSLLNDAPFAAWPGEVRHEQMGALYSRADVVLNCSHTVSCVDL